MMLKKHHGFYYFAELLVILCGFFSLYMLRGDFMLQQVTLITVLIIYALMGILHHALHHTLRIRIVVEYVIISILVFACFLFLKI